MAASRGYSRVRKISALTTVCKDNMCTAVHGDIADKGGVAEMGDGMGDAAEKVWVVFVAEKR